MKDYILVMCVILLAFTLAWTHTDKNRHLNAFPERDNDGDAIWKWSTHVGPGQTYMTKDGQIFDWKACNALHVPVVVVNPLALEALTKR